MSDIIKGLPNICGDDKKVVAERNKKENLYAGISNNNYKNTNASFGIALHMHQPTIPAGGDDLSTAQMISNLQYMWGHQGFGDNHNAPVFMSCYERMSDIVLEYVSKGKNPRVMLDYSGNLFWGLRQMEGGRVLENLKRIASDKKYYQNVEWLGTMWSRLFALPMVKFS